MLDSILVKKLSVILLGFLASLLIFIFVEDSRLILNIGWIIFGISWGYLIKVSVPIFKEKRSSKCQKNL